MKGNVWVVVGVVAVIAIIAYLYLRKGATIVETDGGEAKMSGLNVAVL